MNDLIHFQYEGRQVRTIEKDGEPWFVLRDVCDVIGLDSPHKVAERLDGDERNQIPVTDAIGRQQETTIINESGLYNVILRSDKPEAKQFRKWVTSEVLPTIRKHGAYVTPRRAAISCCVWPAAVRICFRRAPKLVVAFTSEIFMWDTSLCEP